MPQPASNANEALRLRTLHEYGILGTDPEREFDDLAKLASFICGAPISLITFVDTEQQWFKSAIGTALKGTAREVSFCQHVVAGAQTMIVPDTLSDDRFIENPLVRGELGIRFYAGAPLVAPNGQVLGSICVIDQKPKRLQPAQVEALEALSRQVVAQLELRQRMAERERAEKAMRTAEKLAAVGSMARSVAHEINNPLQSLTNLLFMADSAGLAAEDRSQYLQMAQEELRRTSHIVTHALRFHQQSSQASPARLGELSESVLMLFRTRLQHAGVRVEVRDSQTVPLVCFVDDVRQMIAGLVSNALDTLVLRGKGSLLVRIADRAANGVPGVALTVADTGCGIPEEARVKLFQPFNTTKGIRGTGLALWVAKGVLDKHGATVRVRTRNTGECTGTVFRIFFPLSPEPRLSAETQDLFRLPVN